MVKALENEFTVNHRTIGTSRPPFIIAEMSGNHNQSLSRALKIVDAAADAGADALKIQTYTADTMTLDLKKGPFWIRDPKSLWKGQSLYQLYKKAHTPWEWHEKIFQRCRKRGLIGFSTPFDATAVDFLETLRVPLYKIASFENVDLPLIRKVAATGKPMIISTGMATETEIRQATQTARQGGCSRLILLKCTSAYPAPAQESNLFTIPAMRRTFRCQIGLSDHTPGIGVSVAAVAMGISVIERHLTLSRRVSGVDAAFSLEPDELRQLVRETRTAWQALGRVAYGPTPHERASLVFRRSLFIVKDMRAGDRLSPENLRAIRPGSGLPPKFLTRVTGKTVRRDIKRGTPLSLDLMDLKERFHDRK